MLRKIINFINTRPWLRQHLTVLAIRIRAYDKIKKYYYDSQRVSGWRYLLVWRRKTRVDQYSQLTPRAQKIYQALKTAAEKDKEQQ